MARKDIEVRDRHILKLYHRGVSRKQIAAFLDWIPVMNYEAVKKVIYNRLRERRKNERRRPPRQGPGRRKLTAE